MRSPCVCLLLAVGCGRDVVASSARPVEVAPAGKSAVRPPCATEVTKLGPGLVAEQALLGATPAAGRAPCIDIVRAQLARYRPRVLTAQHEGRSQPAPTWREMFNLVAVTNAGMFHADGAPVALIVQDGVAVSKDNQKYLGYLAFDPRSADDVPVVIAGRDCADFDLAELRQRYRSIVQSPRLLGCAGEALPWQDKKQYSAAAIGVDRAGHVVLIHARAAVTMTELAKTVGSLGLVGALFLEGGPEASLVVRGADAELARVGSYETGFVENDANQAFWWLPNVIGLEAVHREAPGDTRSAKMRSTWEPRQ